MLDERLQKIASITYNIDVDACIMPINKWPTADQDGADINSDIGNRSCLAGDSSAILWEKISGRYPLAHATEDFDR